MLLYRVLLSSLALVPTAVGLGLRESHVVSQVINEVEVKGSDPIGFLQTGESQTNEVQELAERAKKLQEEIAEISSEDIGETAGKVGAVVKDAPSLIAKAAATRHKGQKSDDDVFAKLSEHIYSHQDPEDEEAEEDVGSPSGQDMNVATRPGALLNKPDEVQFGLFAKTFYGVAVKTNSFAIDVIMTLKWIDPRVAELIPDGLESMTLSKRESEMSIWLPGIVITNRDIKKYDLISTAVFIKKTGEVFKVERATAIIKNRYVLDQFPFDRQVLATKIASHKYMIKDVVLVPAKEGNGAKKNLMAGESYAFVSVEAGAYQDKDGALKKSRGVLNLTVDRILDKYVQSHLIPGCLLLMISWGVFWFPFVAPFITPRLAMSILTLLNFTLLSLKSAAVLPAGAPFNWNDIINRTILTCMFATIVLNIISEICLHQLKVDELARRVNHECKVFLPFISITGLTLVFSACGRDSYMTLASCSYFANFWVSGCLVAYILFTGTRIMSAMSKNRLKEVAMAK